MVGSAVEVKGHCGGLLSLVGSKMAIYTLCSEERTSIISHPPLCSASVHVGQLTHGLSCVRESISVG